MRCRAYRVTGRRRADVVVRIRVQLEVRGQKLIRGLIVVGIIEPCRWWLDIERQPCVGDVVRFFVCQAALVIPITSCDAWCDQREEP